MNLFQLRIHNNINEIYFIYKPRWSVSSVPLIIDEQLIEAASKIEGLDELDCSGCKLLTFIPIIEGLRWLNCSNCDLLTSIPIIEGLKELDCISFNRIYSSN